LAASFDQVPEHDFPSQRYFCLLSSGLDSCCQLTIEPPAELFERYLQLGNLGRGFGTGKHDKIDSWWQIVLYEAKCFPQRAFPAIPHDRIATLTR
jgi:hypothetical protein